MIKAHPQFLHHLLLLFLSSIFAQANATVLPDYQAHFKLWQDVTVTPMNQIHPASMEVTKQTSTVTPMNQIHPASMEVIKRTFTVNKHARTSDDSGMTRRRLLLNMDELQRFTQAEASTGQSHLTIAVPLPDGTNTAVELRPSNTLSAELQQRYPAIKTWRIRSEHPHIVSGRAELTPGGLYILLQSDTGDQWLTEPLINQKQQAQQLYQSYSKRQSPHHHKQNNEQHFTCGANRDFAPSLSAFRKNLSLFHDKAANKPELNYSKRTGTKILSYDLAISATGEYVQQFGGSAELAYGAIVSTINRINEIYERELGITLRLVSGTETVFTDPSNDPFDNDSPIAAIEQNQQLLDTLFGEYAYDLGHLLGASTRATGIAQIASLCKTGLKAQGFSAATSLLNDLFMVDYVAHELGHQLGATHTFNSDSCDGGNRSAATAFEPGSGNTIMSYAGLCGRDNTRSQAMPQFHAGSVEQIYENLAVQPAVTCSAVIEPNNTAPVVHAGANFTIPARTPFILTGLASDTDDDQLFYSWDQLDTGSASPVGTDMNDNALIKSVPLSDSSTRYVPNVSELLNSDQIVSHGESLPHSGRELNFRLTARDNQGATGSDDIRLSVYDTGADFRFIYPTGSLAAGRHEIHWHVAFTNLPPINCSHVDIAYTNDQGKTFTDLIRNTPNDGGALIELSETAQHTRLKCSNNTFFTLSGAQPHIAEKPTVTSNQQAPTPTAINTENSTNNGGGGATTLTGLLSGAIFAILSWIRRRNIPISNIDTHKSVAICRFLNKV